MPGDLLMCHSISSISFELVCSILFLYILVGPLPRFIGYWIQEDINKRVPCFCLDNQACDKSDCQRY